MENELLWEGLKDLEGVKKARKERLYTEEQGCEKRWSLLHFLLDILILKAKYGWSDRSFNDLLTLWAAVLPKPNFVHTNTYQAKKLISPLTMGVERLHACPNHSILSRGVFKVLMNCPTCGVSRYKRNDNYIEEDMGTKSVKKRKKCGKKGDATKNVEEENNTLGIDDTNQRKIPTLVMWYLSPIDCLRCLFSKPRGSELMRWWASDGRKKGDGVLHHPSDAQHWKGFDAKYQNLEKTLEM